VVWANSQFAAVFFLSFLVSLPRPQVALCVRWTNEGAKRVVPFKEVTFGGLNDVPLNFGGKIAQIGGVNIGLSSLNEKKIKSL